MHVVTLCGSLRAHSSNRALLNAFCRLLPAGVRVTDYDGLGTLPHFNPDLDVDPVAAPVAVLRTLIAAADAVVLSTPEYAHALPGAFKNALDWLVSDPAFVGKRVLILHAARGSTWALDSLKEVLRTMSAVLVEPAGVSVQLGSNAVDADELLRRDEIREALAGSVAALVRVGGAGETRES